MAQPSLRPYLQIVALWVVIQAFPRAMSAQQAPTPSSAGPKTAAANSQATKSSSVGDLFFAQTKVKLLGQTVSGNTYGYHYSFAFPTNTTGDLVQFLIKMGEVAADDPVAAAVLAPLIDKASDAAKQDLNSDLQNMRQLLPYCRGMW